MKTAQKNRISLKSLSILMYKNVIFNYLFRGIGIILSLLSTRVNIMYLGQSLYGMWATIASTASWVSYGDLGIGNGLRNKLAAAVAEDDVEQQKKVIITGLKMLGILSLVLFTLLFVVTNGLYVSNVISNEMVIPMYITNAFFCLDLFLGISSTISYAYQKSWLTSFAQTSTACFRILGVLGLNIINNNSNKLIWFALLNGIGGVLGNLLLILILVFSFRPRLDIDFMLYYDKTLIQSVVGVGLRFFVLQLGCLILYSTDNLIINKYFSSELVTKYEVITKIYKTGDMFFSIILVSLWSAVTYAITKKDFKWIRKEITRLLGVWVFFSAGVICVSLTLNELVKIWLESEAINYETPLICIFAFYAIANAFGSIFVNVSNGMGRLNIQLFFTCIEAVINIPLSIFFATNMGLGIFGIKLATLICSVGSIIFVPIDIMRYLKKSEKDS